MYGIIDTSIQYARFDKDVSAIGMSSGNLQATRLGLKGAEDLGGGYTANFQLEMGFSAASGIAGGTTEWNRGSTVGLASPYGSFDAGYVYLPIYVVYLRSDVKTYGLSSPTAILALEHNAALRGGSGTGSYFQNSIRYRSPDWNGVSGELEYSLGAQNLSSQNDAGRNLGLNLQYLKGFFYAAYGFNRFTFYPTSIATNSSSQLTHIIATTYNFGPFSAGANYVYTRRTDSSRWFASAESITTKVPIGYFDVDLGVARRIETGGARAYAYDVGVVYYLSKKTQLYAYASHILNNSKSSQGYALLNATYAAVTPGFSPLAVTAGIRTSF